MSENEKCERRRPFGWASLLSRPGCQGLTTNGAKLGPHGRRIFTHIQLALVALCLLGVLLVESVLEEIICWILTHASWRVAHNLK